MTDTNSTGTDLVETPAAKGIISQMAMVPRGLGGGVVLLPTTFSEVIAVAQMMAQASHAVPKHLRGNPGACMAIVLRSSNWSMDPFAVATKTYMVNDILAYESQLVSAVVNMRAPVKGRPRVTFNGEGADLWCHFEYTMLDGDILGYDSPTFKEIKTKNSPLWLADPRQQFFYYSARAWARRWVPEVLMGVYTPDEVIEQVQEGEVRATSFTALEERAAAPAAVAEEAKAPVKITHTLTKGHAAAGERYLKLADPVNTHGFIASYVDGSPVDSIAYAKAGDLKLYDKHAPVAKVANLDAKVTNPGEEVSDPQSAPAAEAPEPAIEPASSASDAGTATGAGTSGSGGSTATASEVSEDQQLSTASAAEEGADQTRPIETASAQSAEATQDLSGSATDVSSASAEAAPGTTGDPDPGSSAIDPAFVAFAKTAADSTTWEPIREALRPLKTSAGWAAADPEMQARLHTMAFARLMELIHEGYRFDFTEDLHAYRCYLSWEQALDTMKLHRDMVHKTKAWQALPTDAKIVFDKAYSDAVARLEAAAAYA